MTKQKFLEQLKKRTGCKKRSVFVVMIKNVSHCSILP